MNEDIEIGNNTKGLASGYDVLRASYEKMMYDMGQDMLRVLYGIPTFNWKEELDALEKIDD